MALSQNEILNLTTYTLNEYELDKGKHFENVKEIFKNHGNQPFYVYRNISFVKYFLILSKSGMYTIEVPSRKEHIFLDRLQKACFVQLKKRRTDKAILNSQFADEIYLIINVYK